MIDVQAEQVLPLGAAAHEIPNRDAGRGVNYSTIWRWALKGSKGVRLETCLIGGIRMTSREALARFFERVTAVANGEDTPARSPKQRAKAIAAAEKELTDAGI